MQDSRRKASVHAGCSRIAGPTTYAARRIEGSMLDALRALDTLPRGTRARLRDVRAAVQRLEHRLGRATPAMEVANELAWSLDEFHRCMAEAGAGEMRAGEIESVEDDSSVWSASDEDVSTIDDHADPLHGLQQRQRHAALNAAFDMLEEAERFVMESIYKNGASLRDVGDVLGLSESRVSRMSSEIVAKLRLRLRDW